MTLNSYKEKLLGLCYFVVVSSKYVFKKYI